MKAAVKRLLRDEDGRAMMLCLLVLVTGGLIVTPLLGLMTTGLAAGQVYEKKTHELYAADAGVEDAIWKIQRGDVPVCPGNPTWSYSISDVNGKSVEVTIEWVDGLTYRVESTATGDGSETEIEAYVAGTILYHDFSGITDHVITCQGEIELSPNTEVNPSEGEHAPVENYELDWPTPQELEGFYWEDVKDETPYGSGTIDLDGNNMELGPLYRDGTLEILNSSNTHATLTLTGTIYITGDTLIGKTGKDMTLYLNEHTIFVASDSSDPQKALWIGGKCTIIGPGAVTAVGDISFQPNVEVGMTDPIFVMSVVGTTNVQPGGDFYGSIAGSVEVDLQPGTSINYPEEGFGTLLNFPDSLEAGQLYSIASWEVNPQ